MARKELNGLASVLVMLLALGGCVTTLRGYEPKGPEEAEIRVLLLRWESTYNSHDVSGNLATYNEKAQIMYGGERRVASKSEYSQILPNRMKAVPSVEVGAPSIKVSGDKAEVTTTLSIRGTRGPFTFYLIRENNLWSIMNWKY